MSDDRRWPALTIREKDDRRVLRVAQVLQLLEHPPDLEVHERYGGVVASAQRDLQILWQWKLRPLCVVVSVSVSEDRMQPTISLEREYAGVAAEGLVLGGIDRGVLIQLVKPARHAPGQVLGAGTRQQSAADC